MSVDSERFYNQLVQVGGPSNWCSNGNLAEKSSSNSENDFENYDERENLHEIFVGM